MSGSGRAFAPEYVRMRTYSRLDGRGGDCEANPWRGEIGHLKGSCGLRWALLCCPLDRQHAHAWRARVRSADRPDRLQADEEPAPGADQGRLADDAALLRRQLV